MYKTGKPGQKVYYSTYVWQERREVVLLRYFKDIPSLLHNNSAIIEERGLRMKVDIKDLYRTPE